MDGEVVIVAGETVTDGVRAVQDPVTTVKSAEALPPGPLEPDRETSVETVAVPFAEAAGVTDTDAFAVAPGATENVGAPVVQAQPSGSDIFRLKSVCEQLESSLLRTLTE